MAEIPEPAARPLLQGLYAVTPDGFDTGDLLRVAEAVLRGGCRWLQYRNKRLACGNAPCGDHMAALHQMRLLQARALADLCQRHGACLIINDDIGLALAVGAAGVHLGQEDGSVAEAREQLGAQAIIGASCYQDFDLARAAVAAGASYVAFGAVYASPTKPLAARAPLSLFNRAQLELPVPACAIGGISLARARPLIWAGASLLAVISDLFHDVRDLAAITARAAAYQRLFEDL